MKYFIGILMLIVIAFAIFGIVKYFKEVFKKFKKKEEPAAETVEAEKETPETETASDVHECSYFENRLCNLADENGDCTIGYDSCEKDYKN